MVFMLGIFSIAFQIGDPLEEQGSTVLMINEACSRGYKVFLYSIASLFLDNSGVHAYGVFIAHPITDISSALLTFDKVRVDVDDFNVIMVRQNPPFDVRYLNNLHILSYLRRAAVQNSISVLLNFSEKLSIFAFKEFILPTVITEDYGVALEFFKMHKDVIIKPINDHRGRYAIRASKGITFCGGFNSVRKIFDSPVIVQKYCDLMGDKRVLFINGDYCCPIRRVDDPDDSIRMTSWYGDLKLIKSDLSENEEAICKAVSCKLRELGVFIASVDIIGGSYLLEINVTSPGCGCTFGDPHGIDLGKVLIDKIWERHGVANFA